MITEATVAASAAVALVAPYLAEVGKGAAKKVGEGAGGEVLSWLREKLTGRAQEALADMERHPTNGDNEAALRKQLTIQLGEHHDLLSELNSLLPTQAAGSDQLVQNLGAGARGAQVKGDGNVLKIS